MLASSRVLLVGIGGLGCPAAMVLARAGVGTIGIVDDDVVELSNLHRQVLFRDADVGRPKALAAAERLRELAPALVVETHATRFLPSNAIDLASRYDVVVEGSDNFPTKFLTADACALAKRPVVHAAAVRWHGTALAVSAAMRPCYRCLFEDLPRENAPNCAEAGVVGPVVGVVAAAQAELALALLEGRDVAGTLVTFDGRSFEARRRRIAGRRSCPTCGEGARPSGIDPARYALEACDG